MDHWTATEPLRSAIADSDPFEWLAARDGEGFRDKDGRRTFRFEHESAFYFAKVQTGVGAREAIKELASLRMPPLDASREARALTRLEGAGVPAPKLVGWGVRSRGPLYRRSFVLTEDVGTQQTVGDIADGLDPADQADRRRLIEEVAELTGRMHTAGVNHRDLYFGHILVKTGPGGERSLVLIDLHRAQVWSKVPERWLAKDLGTLGFAALPYRLSRTERLRFVMSYAGSLDRARALWRSPMARRVLKRIERIDAERIRKGDRFGG